MYFEIYQGDEGMIGSSSGVLADRQWRWRLRSDGNYKTVASGEAYHNKKDCLAAIDLLKSTDASTPVNEV